MQWDLDCNGLLSKKELRAAFAALGLHVSPKSFKSLWRALDSDRSGTITPQELLGTLFAPKTREKRSATLRESRRVSTQEHDNQQLEAKGSTKGSQNFKQNVADMSDRSLDRHISGGTLVSRPGNGNPASGSLTSVSL